MKARTPSLYLLSSMSLPACPGDSSPSSPSLGSSDASLPTPPEVPPLLSPGTPTPGPTRAPPSTTRPMSPMRGVLQRLGTLLPRSSSGSNLSAHCTNSGHPPHPTPSVAAGAPLATSATASGSLSSLGYVASSSTRSSLSRSSSSGTSSSSAAVATSSFSGCCGSARLCAELEGRLRGITAEFASVAEQRDALQAQLSALR
eukprot:RCo039508